MIVEIAIALIVGALIQRIYSARSKGFTKLGKSWEVNHNSLYKKLHRFYCECCPRRHYCEVYKEKVKK
jgi:hypothetical protein